mmetsp:Transcript_18439/g.22656  ORF Transcript_18439/g.22656 Transcript_18439/m.22656 type:complete len:118 (-) Transcript_18439:107-460(-)
MYSMMNYVHIKVYSDSVGKSGPLSRLNIVYISPFHTKCIQLYWIIVDSIIFTCISIDMNSIASVAHLYVAYLIVVLPGDEKTTSQTCSETFRGDTCTTQNIQTVANESNVYVVLSTP